MCCSGDRATCFELFLDRSAREQFVLINSSHNKERRHARVRSRSRCHSCRPSLCCERLCSCTTRCCNCAGNSSSDNRMQVVVCVQKEGNVNSNLGISETLAHSMANQDLKQKRLLQPNANMSPLKNHGMGV